MVIELRRTSNFKEYLGGERYLTGGQFPGGGACGGALGIVLGTGSAALADAAGRAHGHVHGGLRHLGRERGRPLTARRPACARPPPSALRRPPCLPVPHPHRDTAHTPPPLA